jgi:hypothetical protein
VRIISGRGGNAAHAVRAPVGWATSNSDGLAFLIQKGHPHQGFDFEGLAGTTIEALSQLRKRPDGRWRAAVDRAVVRR